MPIATSEIVVGVLEDRLVQYLLEKVRRLQSKYRIEWRIFRGNRHGVVYTNRQPVAPTSTEWPIWPAIDHARPREYHGTITHDIAAAVGSVGTIHDQNAFG